MQKNTLQTIFGAGGAIGKPLAKELKQYTDRIRLVSRNPKKVNETDELFPVANLSRNEVFNAIKGSEVVYITIGFEYRLKVWQKVWPEFMKNVIDACKEFNTRLVFFDNVYMYDKNEIPHMTEDSKLNPPSKKGVVRKSLHDMIFKAVEKNEIKAVIARSADFYGPDNKNSMVSEMMLKPLKSKKKAQLFGDVNKIHTYTYTPDAAKATALLGNTEDTWNQVWHVPTTKSPLSNKQWMELIAKEVDAPAKIQYVPVWMIKLLGIFMPIMREFPEMLYQYDRDYVFDSSKFEKRFGIAATPVEEGIKQMVNSMK